MPPNDDCMTPSIEALEPADREAIAAHLLRLSPADRYLRFGGHGIDDARVQAHATSIDFARDRVLAIRDRQARVVAVAEVLGCGTSAEIAFSVDADQRGQGLAGALLSAAIADARICGVDSLLAQFVSDNRAMRRVFERAGLIIAREDGEYTASLCLREGNPVSV